jgi:hypothetical protein
MLIAIRDNADQGRATRRRPRGRPADLGLIRLMANASVRSIDGDPGYL